MRRREKEVFYETEADRRFPGSEGRFGAMKELESLSAFRARTGAFIYNSLPLSGGLETNPGLPLKVGADGRMEPFMGNTVVFPLPEPVRQALERMRERLYRTCAPALAEPLEASSFHITLHDLLCGKPSRELAERVDRVQSEALACLGQITGGTVRLRSTALFNMVNASMVLGFEPEDEESCGRLMAWYEALQEVVHLDYPLTPHVTLAYFRPGTISGTLTGELRRAAEEIGRWERLLLELPAEAAEYQTFSDMNHYRRER